MFSITGLVVGIVILVVWVGANVLLDHWFSYYDNTGKKVRALHTIM